MRCLCGAKQFPDTDSLVCINGHRVWKEPVVLKPMSKEEWDKNRGTNKTGRQTAEAIRQRREAVLPKRKARLKEKLLAQLAALG